MSPPSSRAQAKRQRSMVVSIVLVLVVAVGALTGVVVGNWSPKLGLDLAGGLSVVYKPAHKVSNAELNETASILQDRILGLGVSGAQVNTQQGDVVVSVPGIKDGQTLLNEIGHTAQLYFRPALCFAPPLTLATPAKVSAKPVISGAKKGKSTTGKTASGKGGTSKAKGDKGSKATRKSATHRDRADVTSATSTTTTAPKSTTTTTAPATTTTTAPSSTTTTVASSTTTTAPTATATTTPAATTTAPTTTTTTEPTVASTGPLPTTCTPTTTQLVVANSTGTSSSSTGVNYNSILPDQTLSTYKSTSSKDDNPHNYVLLPILGQLTGDRLLLGPSELAGTAVKTANAQLSSTGQWEVNMSLTGSGSTGWDTMAQKYFHEIIGIELDGVVQSDPITLPNAASFSSFDGNVQISGAFNQSEAQQLALALQYGALPVRLNQQDVQTVTPTLGHSALVAGLGAGMVGLLLVLLYTIFYYRLLGIVVLSGLTVTGALLYAIISALGHTAVSPSFDLAGVTGIIVSIGITVDSYIVYFERLKDETRSGKTVRTSVDRGFKSAWRTVVAADTVSLVAAVVLFVVAVGEVKGFAFFLGLSTLMDVFMTYFFTRPLVILLGRNERLTSGRRFGIARGLAVDSGDAQ